MSDEILSIALCPRKSVLDRVQRTQEEYLRPLETIIQKIYGRPVVHAVLKEDDLMTRTFSTLKTRVRYHTTLNDYPPHNILQLQQDIIDFSLAELFCKELLHHFLFVYDGNNECRMFHTAKDEMLAEGNELLLQLRVTPTEGCIYNATTTHDEWEYINLLCPTTGISLQKKNIPQC